MRLKPADADIKNVPSTINLAGSKATLRILKPDEIKQLGTTCIPENPSEYSKRYIKVVPQALLIQVTCTVVPCDSTEPKKPAK